MEKDNKNFKEFTNCYELSKTLRFELKPTRKTEEMLKDNGVFEKDELIQKKYTETKKYFDRLHREFVKDALQDVGLSGLDNYKNALNGV
ncbi:MAG: hypothetical protein U9P70_04290, partial [Patescibacteria group bacterium]|nr:hypothetical protein [Patescibacteria group bacterium]